MSFEKRDMQGTLFFNDKQSEKQPDLKGYVLINGVEYDIAAWAGREGSKVAYSLKAQVKTERRDGKPMGVGQRAAQGVRRPDPISTGRPRHDDDSEIPF